MTRSPLPPIPDAPLTHARTRTVRRLACAAVFGVVVAGCGSDATPSLSEVREALDQVEEAVDAAVDSADTDTGADPGSGTDSDQADGNSASGVEDAGAEEAVAFAPLSLDAVVAFGDLEYTVQELTVVDLDAENDTLEHRMHGLQLEFDLLAHNPMDTQRAVNLPRRLTWLDPETGASHEVGGHQQYDIGVPAGSSAGVDIELRVSPQQMETFNLETAVLWIGDEGRHAVQVPLGDEGELVHKFPHYQEDMVGQVMEFDDGGVTWTIDSAYVIYTYGNGRLQDDQVLLEIVYTFANNTERQQCHRRGTGTSFSLHNNDTGMGTTDLDTERCVATGDSETWRTGFLLPYDSFSGGHTMTGHMDYWYTSVDGDALDAPIEFEVLDNPLPWSQWP